jgi:dTDP-glucose pyrophosphorylase
MLAGIKDILIILTLIDIPIFEELLENGSAFRVNRYAIQPFLMD